MAAKTVNWCYGARSCRCCLSQGGSKDIFDVYFLLDTKEVYSEMLLETFNVDIKPMTLNNNICELCISKLRDAAAFKQQVLECERTFEQYLQESEQEVLGVGGTAKPEVDLKVEFEEQDENNDFFAEEPIDEDVECKQECEDEVLSVEDLPLAKIRESSTYNPENTTKLRKCFINLDRVALKRKICETMTVGDPIEEQIDKSKDNSKDKSFDSNSTTRQKSSKVVTKTPPAKKKCVITIKRDKTKPAKKNVDTPTWENKQEDTTTEDTVRKNASSILRHSTAYPFQPSKKSFRCCFCPYGTSEYNDPIVFRNHMDTIHSDIDKSDCLKHRNESMTRVDVTNLKCIKKKCDIVYSTLDDLAKHLIEFHKVDIDLSQGLGLVPIRLEKDKFVCVICSKPYTTLHQLSRHSGSHFYRNICYKCGSNFETLKGLKKHVTVRHSEHKYVCYRCNQSFPDLNAKKEHLRTNSKCRSFKCQICKERFLSLESQQEHEFKVHGKAKHTFSCPECGEVFEKRIGRYLHFKMMHTDDFKCSYCELKFSNTRCLQDHIARVHTFERRYKCTVCDKAFTDSKTLRTHSIIHDESKKHACPACNRKFTMKCRLKQHIQKYHPDILSSVFPVT